jgi:P-type E1-E2 ATPase
MENKLKHDSAKCVASLKEANIDIKMISGDNALTCI